nr:Gag-Pol polyprotein [Tanacetum cinerariifolium]
LDRQRNSNFEGSPITRTERFQETYKNVSQEIRDQLNAEAEAVQIILTGIDNDIYSTVDACPNACEMWKAIERNQCKVTNHQVNVQFLLQLQPKWKRAKKIARVANPLALVAQQQPVYHPHTHPTHYTQNSSTRSQQAATKNKGKEIINSPQPIYDQEPSMVAEDDETANQDNSPRINRSVGYENQRIGNVVGDREIVGSTVMQKSRIQCYNCKEFGHVARECQKPKRAKDAAYHREKMLLCKQEEAEIQLNAEQADWRDDTDDDELDDQELEAHYMYMAQLQEVSPDAADSGPIFDDEPLQKVSNDDHYNVFAMESEHPEQSESVHDTYPIDQDAHNVIDDSLDMSYDREEIDQNDDDDDLTNEREIEDLKKIKSLESSNNYFKEENNRLSETNNLMYTDYKKSEAELARRNSREYASQMEIECAKVRGDFLSYKMEYQKSCTKYTQTINDLNQTISNMKDKLSAHQETISIHSHQKEAHSKLYKTRKDKE